MPTRVNIYENSRAAKSCHRHKLYACNSVERDQFQRSRQFLEKRRGRRTYPHRNGTWKTIECKIRIGKGKFNDFVCIIKMELIIWIVCVLKKAQRLREIQAHSEREQKQLEINTEQQKSNGIKMAAEPKKYGFTPNATFWNHVCATQLITNHIYKYRLFIYRFAHIYWIIAYNCRRQRLNVRQRKPKRCDNNAIKKSDNWLAAV